MINVKKKILPILLMIWPYLCFVTSYIENEELSEFYCILYLILTVIVYLLNIINAFRFKDYHQLVFWNMIIKIVHIPFYLLVFAVGLMFVLAAVVPALGTIAPFIIFWLFVVDLFLMITSSMHGINALVKARKEKVITRKYMFVHILFHFLFVADVISSIILYSSLKRKK